MLHLACRDTLQHNQRLFCLVHSLTLTELNHILKLNSHLVKGAWSAEALEAAPSPLEEAKGENKIKWCASFMMKVISGRWKRNEFQTYLLKRWCHLFRFPNICFRQLPPDTPHEMFPLFAGFISDTHLGKRPWKTFENKPIQVKKHLEGNSMNPNEPNQDLSLAAEWVGNRAASDWCKGRHLTCKVRLTPARVSQEQGKVFSAVPCSANAVPF